VNIVVSGSVVAVVFFLVVEIGVELVVNVDVLVDVDVLNVVNDEDSSSVDASLTVIVIEGLVEVLSVSE
jgi:hypothetical protein